jgi:hypothetical protein
MRKILILTVLIFGYYLPTFSQLYNRPHNYQLQYTTYSNLSLKNNFKTLNLVNPFDTNRFFNNSTYNKKLMYPALPGLNPKSGQDLTAIFQMPQTFDNMPCVVPQGYFPMLIVKPDSTIRYSLLIKKY